MDEPLVVIVSSSAVITENWELNDVRSVITENNMNDDGDVVGYSSVICDVNFVVETDSFDLYLVGYPMQKFPAQVRLCKKK